MKTIYKHFYLTLCAALAFAMGACTEEVDYVPATSPEGAQVYFPTTLASKIDLDVNGTSFNVQIGRSATEAATVGLAVTDESGLFTVPSSVSFAAGEKMANLTITYDPATLEFDDYKQITIAIADESNKTIYGESSYTFKAGIPSPWTSLGMCTFSDYFMFENSYQVELQQNDLDKNLYRLVRPYREGLSAEGYGGVTGDEQEYPEFRVLQPGDVWKEVNVTMSDLVAFTDISTEWNNTSYDATIYLLHPSRFTSYADESYWTYSKVVSYQENGLPAVIELAPYYYMFGVGGWNYTTSPMVTIVFPGVVIKDYSVDVTYLGRMVGADESNSVVANITLGEDVTSVKYAMAADASPSDLAQAIIDGSVESAEVTASGEVKIPVTEDGDYTIVVVSYDGEEAQEMAYTSFEITLGASEWESLGMAQYTEDIVGPAYGGEVLTYDVEVLASNKTPGLYRLVNPYGEAYPYNEEGDWDASRKYYLEINAADPEGVYIALQNTGLNWGDGNFYIYSYAAYYLDSGYSLEEVKTTGVCGTLVDGVITFPAKSILYGFQEDSSSLYYGNLNGAFKVVLPGATAAATAETSARVASRSASAFSKHFNSNKENVKKLHDSRMFGTMAPTR